MRTFSGNEMRSIYLPTECSSKSYISSPVRQCSDSQIQLIYYAIGGVKFLAKAVA